MKCYRRRGVTVLVQVIAMLPLIAALGITAFMLTNRGLRAQGSILRESQTNATISAIARQLEADAASSESAAVSAEEPRELRLMVTADAENRSAQEAAPREITYKIVPGRVVRTVLEGERVESVREWTVGEHVRTDFAIEEILGRPAIAWLRCVVAVRPEQGPDMTHQLSFAAAVRHGGGR